MSTYEMNIDTLNTSLSYYQAEKFIYGSSRLGMLKDSVNVLGSAFKNTDSSNIIHTLGNKRYELSNHLGNVLSVISDKPIPKMEEEILEESDYSDGAVLDFDFWSPTTAVIENGRIKVTTHQIYASIVKDIATVPGKIYRVHFTADINNQGGISAYAYDQALLQFLGREKCYSNGDYTMEFMAKSTTSSLRFETYSNLTRDFYIDNLKIEEVVNPVYVNDFSTNYTPFNSYGGTLSLDNGRLKTVTTLQWGNVQQPVLSTQPGVKYRVSFYIDLNNEGSITPFARDVSTSTNLTVINATSNGEHHFEFTATGTTTLIGLESPHTYSRTFYLDDFFVTYQQHTTAPYETGNAVSYWQADIKAAQDYSPFGVILDGRDFNSSESRYGFNSMEKDDQFKGRGNSYDFGARMLDPRLGRWLMIDPLFAKYPDLSPYNFTLNNPIYFVDPDGKDGIASVRQAEPIIKKSGKVIEGGTLKNPHEMTIKANYYYNAGTINNIGGTTALSSAIDAYNSSDYVVKGADGQYYKVSFEISPIPVNEINHLDIYRNHSSLDKEQNLSFGNVITTDIPSFNDRLDKDELGAASENFINLKTSSIKDAVSQGANMEITLFNLFIHEIGHNLGGAHEDAGAMNQNVVSEHTNIGGINTASDYVLPATKYSTQKNKLTKDNVQAIVNTVWGGGHEGGRPGQVQQTK